MYIFRACRGSFRLYHGFSFFLLNQITVLLLIEGVNCTLHMPLLCCLLVACFHLLFLFWCMCSFLWPCSSSSSKAEQKDALNSTVLSAYLRLQSEGLLSTWTNSFVGPWDPSQGEHNPGNNYVHYLHPSFFLPKSSLCLFMPNFFCNNDRWEDQALVVSFWPPLVCTWNDPARCS